MALSGDHVAATAGADVSNLTLGTTTSTSFVTSLTTAGTCGVAFVAPPSGKVTVHLSTGGFHNTANSISRTGYRIGTGATVAAGTTFQAASLDHGMIAWPCANTAHDYREGVTDVVSGLTPGDTYNACMAHLTTTGTASFNRRQIIIEPRI